MSSNFPDFKESSKPYQIPATTPPTTRPGEKYKKIEPSDKSQKMQEVISGSQKSTGAAGSLKDKQTTPLTGSPVQEKVDRVKQYEPKKDLSSLGKEEGAWVVRQQSSDDACILFVNARPTDEDGLYARRLPYNYTTLSLEEKKKVVEDIKKEVMSADSMRAPSARGVQKQNYSTTLREQLTKAVGENSDNVSSHELFDRLKSFNKEIVSKDPNNPWEESSRDTDGSLFSSISSPKETRVQPRVNANFLDNDKSFVGFMYPSTSTRNQVLTTFMDNKITRHVHLANNFVVFLKNPGTEPVFPMSRATFESLIKKEPIEFETEAGKITVTYKNISGDPPRGSFTVEGRIDGKPVRRDLEWPLDSIKLSEDLTVELQNSSSGERDTYVYKNAAGEEVHSLEVGKIAWDDFAACDIKELHKSALWLQGAESRSAGCRAGVGRTGTLFVATKMVEWTKQHPGEALQQSQVLRFVIEGRLNRDPQVVQTESQLETLMKYRDYLNGLTSIDKLLKSPEMQADSKHRIGKSLREDLKKLKDANSETTENLRDKLFEEHLTCPITQAIFRDPVVTNEGQTYERQAIETWLTTHSTCPLTRKPLTKALLKPDKFVIDLKKALDLQALEKEPSSTAGKNMVAELSKIVVKEPIKWCRIVSAVMPKNKYFVRMKGLGEANDYVIEFRGKDKVMKSGFHVNNDGTVQCTGRNEKFKNIDELVQNAFKGQFTDANPPTRFTGEEIADLNKEFGKDLLMSRLYEDATLTALVSQLELRIDDKTCPQNLREGGYVRAGLSPCSFPCFTYVSGTKGGKEAEKVRIYYHEGKAMHVNPASFAKAKNAQGIAEQINTSNLTPDIKERLLHELEKVKNALDYTETVTLFLKTEKPFSREIVLAKPDVAYVEGQRVNAYMVAVMVPRIKVEEDLTIVSPAAPPPLVLRDEQLFSRLIGIDAGY